MLNVRKYMDLLPKELVVAVPAGGAFGAVYTGAKSTMADDTPPSATDLGQEIAANSVASGAAAGTGLLLNKYLR